MDNPGAPLFVIVFIIFWCLLGIVSELFFWLNKNTSLKKKVFPWFIIASGSIFYCFILFVVPINHETWWILLLLGGGTVWIGWLSIRCTKFCDHCGKKNVVYPFFAQMEYCHRCGHKYEP